MGHWWAPWTSNPIEEVFTVFYILLFLTLFYTLEEIWGSRFPSVTLFYVSTIQKLYSEK